MERNYLTNPAIESETRLLQKVSKPGEYYGYSEMLYQEIIRSSQYIPGFDGTKLAIDIYRPAKNGQLDGAPWPADTRPALRAVMEVIYNLDPAVRFWAIVPVHGQECLY
jgi:predicted acyl esterase